MRFPLVDLGLAAERIRGSAEWMDRVAVERALGIGRYWAGKIMKLLATRITEHGPLVGRDQVAELLRREIRMIIREQARKLEKNLAKKKKIEAARQQRKQRTLDRIRVAVQLRMEGWAWARIGKELGVSRQRAHQMGDEYVRRGRLMEAKPR